MIENVIVQNSKWTERDIEILFDNEEVYFTTASDISELLKELGIFKSTSEARRAGRVGTIPEGWSGEYKASKKYRLWIWNPTE